eukprot:GEZU01024813.1.p1 GENE.GEZU01024813.1~~GEZU01024813.1.p1  ORF type:complete len:439 (-),score=50.08 GEZU01024813.1:96-1412(-)
MLLPQQHHYQFHSGLGNSLWHFLTYTNRSTNVPNFVSTAYNMVKVLDHQQQLFFINQYNNGTNETFLVRPGFEGDEYYSTNNSSSYEEYLFSADGAASAIVNTGFYNVGAPHLLFPLTSISPETIVLLIVILLILSLLNNLFYLLLDASWHVIRVIAVGILRCGPIPNHIAIIMDGNRRWAQGRNMKRSDGHRFGYSKLKESLHWCERLGIKTVTVYAFSIENFKRSAEEVKTLMDLANEKFKTMISDGDIVQRHGMQVRIMGKFDMLPEYVKQSASKAIHRSRFNNKVVLNLCMPYTSTEEIANALNTLSEAVNDGKIELGDITTDLVDACLYSHPAGDPELLIRTSGETRFSDFLLWQSVSNTYFAIVKELWPDFSEWSFFSVIWKYQSYYPYLQRFHKVVNHRHRQQQQRAHVSEFLSQKSDAQRKIYEQYANQS